ncbi:recombination protein RecR [Candidatus Peregrinibacteria bacterium CG10_big_fil_rev_8_21_14_0_10_49_16]|nr:MAG: recombination protein RecR [Candidatus Peregrinibacteria bacterium CG22_combo_CG10-13_8_21_14_all_49_11]PIR52452.1 MAG: recombination protein RecR [Candidatus Peregrinibacteria bacterium CG10_big_fil_rev_8_21_14_0_10_49_16]
MALLPEPITRVIEEFSKLPGIGPKSAERLTFHLLRNGRASPESLGKALLELKTELQYCKVCQMVTLKETCQICDDQSRKKSVILVVEEPLEVVAFERTSYDGVYHVLHGVLSPIDGMGPEQLRVAELVERVRRGGIGEVIVATDPDIEGEATASFLQQKLQTHVEKITRLAHGLPMGADIEFADQVTLKEALVGRRAL